MAYRVRFWQTPQWKAQAMKAAERWVGGLRAQVRGLNTRQILYMYAPCLVLEQQNLETEMSCVTIEGGSGCHDQGVPQ